MRTTIRQWLRDLPVRRKLMLMVLTTSAVILLLACAGLFILQLHLFRQTFSRDLQALAEVVAANCAGPLSFGDKKAAEEVLSALNHRPQIVAASIRLPDGECWVHLGTTNARSEAVSSGARAARFEGNNCFVSQPIRNGSEGLGTLHLRADFDTTRRDLLGYYATILVVVLTGSFLVGVLLSTRLQRFISQPIQQLAGVVRTIAVAKDYSVRARSAGRDEIGELTDAFNEMVSEIQARDTALEEGRQRFEAAVTGSSDGLWDWDLVRNTTYFSPRWKSMLGFEDRELENTVATFRERLHPEDAARVGAAIQAYLEGRAESYEIEFRMRHKDGSHRWILSRGAARREASGQALRFSGAHTDITQRKEAEAELARLHKELVETSRQAGMAEVATGVLHNVGNVLNSVNVTSNLLSDQLRKSHVGDLALVVALLREHQADLGGFLTRHPKGQKVPDVLAQLADQLAKERDRQLRELEGLRANVEHIKDIVAMQQNYAKVSGVVETLNVTDLVEDALRLNAGALARHQVHVVRCYERTPEISVDKHKVLQILVNLIRNAKYACTESGRTDKRLTLRLTHGEQRVRVTVEDNGVGIAPENLTRIFQHGFTTRKDGHGFGLHSGALAARELGGSLTASSDGPGRGATFTLELPLQPHRL